MDHSPRFDMLERCGLRKGRQSAHAQGKIPRGVGQVRDYAESANIGEACQTMSMAAGTHTRVLGTPPVQIRTYEEVSNDLIFLKIHKSSR